MSLAELRNRALEVAVGEIGVREIGFNRGPRIVTYQRSVGIFPGDPWCMAFVVWCYDQAARSLGMENPLPRTGSVARFFQKCAPLWRSKRPTVGSIYGHLRDPKDPKSRGHCGIVFRGHEAPAPPPPRPFSGVEGNTNAYGSKGEGVMVQHRTASYVNLGYVDVGRESPPGTPPADGDEAGETLIG